jgi:hypothetical protein
VVFEPGRVPDTRKEDTMQLTKLFATITAVAAAAVGGAAIADAASSGSSSTASTTTTPAASAPAARPAMPPHGSPAHEDAEQTVTRSAAAKAQAAAVAYVGSGTAGAVTTDYTQSGYEVTVTRSDGSSVEVHLDSSFDVVDRGAPPALG